MHLPAPCHAVVLALASILAVSLSCADGAGDAPSGTEGEGEGEGGEGEGEGEGQPPPSLCAAPTSIDFGDVRFGNQSEAAVVTVTNCRDAVGTLSASLTGDFVIVSNECNELAPLASCEISVAFTPTALGARTGSLFVDTVGLDEVPPAAVSLTGRGVDASLSLSPTEAFFGFTFIGASASATFSIRNDGDASSDPLDIALDGADSQQFFALSAGCSGLFLAPGQSCDVTVIFAPTSAGDKAATLVVTGGNEVLDAALTGTASPEDILTIAPAARDFGAVVPGLSSAVLDFVVTNISDVDSGVASTTITGPDAAEFTVVIDECEGASLAPIASCTVSVQFAPAAGTGASGARSALLTVALDPGGSVEAALTGTALDAELPSAEPTAHDFGDVDVGASSPAITFTLSNAGGASTGVLAAIISGSDQAEFPVDTDGCSGLALGPAEQCVVTLRFAPTSEGVKSASLTITDAASGAASIAALSGNGVILEPALVVSPLGIDFGSVPVLSVSASEDIVITNAGEAATTAAPVVTLGGANAAQFEIVSSTCLDALTPSEQCAVAVRYRPTVAVAHSATVTVESDGIVAGVAQLTGTGLVFEGLVFTVNGGAFDFGDVVIGQQSTAQRVVTVTNNAAVDVEVTTVALVGRNASDFVMVSEDCDVLPPSASCTITVAFAPQAPEGAKTAQLQVTGNPDGTAVTTGDLTGNAVP